MKKLSVVLGLFCALSAHATEYLTNPDGSDFYIKSLRETTGLSISNDGRFISFGNNLFDRFYNRKNKIFLSPFDETLLNTSVKMSSDAKYFVWSSSEDGFNRLNYEAGVVENSSADLAKKVWSSQYDFAGSGNCVVFSASSKFLLGATPDGAYDFQTFRYCFDSKNLEMMPMTGNTTVNTYSISVSDAGDVVSYGSSGLTQYGYNFPFINKVYSYDGDNFTSASTDVNGVVYSDISGDGRFIYYFSWNYDQITAKSALYVFDRSFNNFHQLKALTDSGEKTLMLDAAVGGKNMASSYDGRYLIFMSKEAYVPEDVDGIDFYVFDMFTSKIKLVPRVNGAVSVFYKDPVISNDNRYVAFIAEDRSQNIGLPEAPIYKTRVVTARNPFLDDDTFCKAY